jgi:FkbM family methyltransferase
LQEAIGDLSTLVWANTTAGFAMLVHLRNDSISATIRRSGQWEYDHLAFMEALRPPTVKRYLDIGANLGYHALVAASRGYEVDAFEAMPANAALINMSLCAQSHSMERRVRLLDVGFSSRPRKCLFVSEESNSADAIARCDLAGPHEFAQPGYRARGSFRMQTLSETLTTSYYAMKIDIEGHEHEALGPEGAGAFFRAHTVEHILFESWPVPSVRRTFWPYLASLGYPTLRPRLSASERVALMRLAVFKGAPLPLFGSPFEGRRPPKQLVEQTSVFDVLATRDVRGT